MSVSRINVGRVIDGHDAEQIALIDLDTPVTYGDLRVRVAQIRHGLDAHGIGIGGVVGVAAGNETDFVAACLAGLALGAVVMPLNPSSPVPEMQRKIEAGKPDLLLVGELGQPLLGHTDDFTVPLFDLATFAREVQIDPEVRTEPIDAVDRHLDDSAFYMATSGVSGAPKVAVLSHHNLDWMQEALEQTPEALQPDDITLGVLPFSHIFGLNVVMLAGLRAGSQIVLQRRFDADESLRLIRQYNVTLLTGAPPMWQRWAKTDAPDDSLRSVRYAASGAAALPLGVFEAVRDRFGVEIAQGYGLTETAPVVTLGRGFPVRPSSVGKVMEGVEVALVDQDGHPVDVGDEGEIVVRSPGVFLGYLDDPTTTSTVLTGDGWLWTGDVGIFDEEGYLYLVDRIKDVVIVSGFNVYPAEVENVLMAHPDVRGAIVTGSADEETGEKVVAHVSGRATEADLIEHVAAQLSRYKRPTEYHFLDELPIAPNGKPIRRELR